MKQLFFLFFLFGVCHAQAQDDKYYYRFPKASLKVSLFTPEICLETASNKGSTFVLGVGSLAEKDSNDSYVPLFYVYAQYRYYFKTPKFAFLNDSKRAEGFYVHGGGYTYQSQVNPAAGSLIVGGGGGFQVYYGKYFFTDIFIAPGIALLSDGRGISFRPTITGGLKIGVDITAFEDK